MNQKGLGNLLYLDALLGIVDNSYILHCYSQKCIGTVTKTRRGAEYINQE